MSSSPSLATIRHWIEISMRRSMHDFVRYAKQQGLSMTQVAVLFKIHHHGAVNVTEIGEHLGVSSPAASQLLERLVQMGLVAREEDPTDRRLKRIALTEQGEAAFREGLRAREKWLDELVDRLSPAEQAQVLAAFEVLIQHAEQMEGGPLPPHHPHHH